MIPASTLYGDKDDSPNDESTVFPSQPGGQDKSEEPDHPEERQREEKGNRGLDEIPGFGEGA
jgi:hypothetical protein